MKKFHLLLVVVLFTATLSAFTTKQPTTVYYRNASGVFLEKTTAGSCTSHPTYACEYIWTGAEDDDPLNENNYEAVAGEENKRFIPSNP